MKTPWTTTLRHRLGMERVAFAKLAGVDVRTVTRWETGVATPQGTADVVLRAIQEKLARDPARAEKTIRFVTHASSIGGLAYLLLRLLDLAIPPSR